MTAKGAGLGMEGPSRKEKGLGHRQLSGDWWGEGVFYTGIKWQWGKKKEKPYPIRILSMLLLCLK